MPQPARPGSRPSSLHCLFSYHNPLGGAVHAALNVCRYLSAAGYGVEAAASYSPGDDVGYLAADYPGFPAHRFDRVRPARYFNAPSMEPWLEANLGRFDVADLHGVFVLTTARAARVCRRMRKPYYVRSHGALDPFDLRKHSLLKRFIGPLYVRPLLSGAAGVICTTRTEADRLVTYGARPERCVVPLPVPAVEPAAGAGAEFRARHGIPQDARVVLFLSRLDYKKGLEFLVPALAACRAAHPRLWFVLAGSGEPGFVESVRGLVARHGIGGMTTATGFITGAEKRGAFGAADLFALPSLNENFGIVLVEAMSAGLPLLVSDQVYIHQEVVAAGAGFLCRTSVESCTAALRGALADPDGLALAGRRAAALARSHFGPEAATLGLARIYAAGLAGGISNGNGGRLKT